MSEQDVKSFLASGALESYLLGLSSKQEEVEAVHMIETYPEVRAKYDELSAEIKQFADHFSSTEEGDPDALATRRVDSFMATMRTRNTVYKARRNMRFRRTMTLAVGLISAYAIYITTQYVAATQHNDHLVERAVELENLVDAQRQKIAYASQLEDIVFRPSTQKVVLEGKVASHQLCVQAFWNHEERKALLQADSLPQLANNKCYQLWADVHGEMLNLGVLERAKEPVNTRFLSDASSLNITIEPDGGSDHPSVTNLVASCTLGN